MSDQTERVPSQPKMRSSAAEFEKQAGASYHEAPEIQGWALQWDTTELRKKNLARKMSHMRQSRDQ